MRLLLGLILSKFTICRLAKIFCDFMNWWLSTPRLDKKEEQKEDQKLGKNDQTVLRLRLSFEMATSILKKARYL